MKLVNPSFEIWEQNPGLEGIYKQIELAARNCYKSEGSIKEGSAEKMVNGLIKNQHLAMLEHATVHLSMDETLSYGYKLNPYSKVICEGGKTAYVTTNLRVLVENNWLDDLKYLCEPTESHEKRVTVKYTADIHFYKDITRHRVFSWAIESTRWCNYIREKFGGSVAFMMPSWINEADIPELEEDCRTMESIYFKWINKGYQAQHAAYFLPQGTKAEVVMTGFISDWKHFFFLRADDGTGPAHPDVKALTVPLKAEFINRGLINQ